ncbi:MAG: hypothetical protein ACREPM_19240, partial [Gemmatimonadaceae bacterium]
MTDAAQHLARLASHPRPAGSAAAASARQYCAEVLRTVGFSVAEQSFEYSAFAGAWAMPLAGVVASLSAILLYLGRETHWLIAAATTSLALMIGALAW